MVVVCVVKRRFQKAQSSRGMRRCCGCLRGGGWGPVSLKNAFAGVWEVGLYGVGLKEGARTWVAGEREGFLAGSILTSLLNRCRYCRW
jgi:hypothetical protein